VSDGEWVLQAFVIVAASTVIRVTHSTKPETFWAWTGWVRVAALMAVWNVARWPLR